VALTLAIVCSAGRADAQQNLSGPNALLASLDRKHAAGRVIEQVQPEYPAVARVNFIQGRVRLDLTVNSRGNVESVHVLEGNAILAQSALEASRGWIYSPLTTPTGPAGFRTTVAVKFELNFEGAQSELTPRQAERDFLRQVIPPQVTNLPEGVPARDGVHVRLLVNDHGQVVDMEVSTTVQGQMESVSETLRGWTFRPAHWGNLPIASYLDVEVPVTEPSVTQAAAQSSGR
jgi:TonB family protein